ncbi:MAG: sialate O-acetylesterase, partial [Bacteroidota bacterium]|nr:sialate O-acetylesterase [Bacteroidota bacterium]
MKKNKFIKSIILLFIPSLIIITACTFLNNPATNIHLSHLFSDHMVLQRDHTVPVWGSADPGGIVTVEITGQQKTTEVSKDGNWQIDLQPMSAGGPYRLSIFGQDTIIFENVMVGEVWICSGQSNMEMPLAGGGMVLNYQEEISDANYPNIRLITVNKAVSTIPIDSIVSSGWEECNPGTIPEFSAVAYFFGRHLHNKLNVPIGLIHTSWGGTVAEAWTSAEALKTMPDFVDEVQSIEMDTTDFEEAMEIYEAKMKQRQKEIVENDAGYHEGNYIWNVPELELSGWEGMKLPSLWERAGHKNLDGIVWFRKKVNIPASMSGKELILHLGPINDDDITWFNGVKVGGLNGVNELRKYKLPGSIVKTGTNLIAVRVYDMGNNGGFWGKPEELKIEDNSGHKISLAGTWSYKIGLDLEPLSPRPHSPDDPNRPTVLYNAMIHPLIPYAIRGAIWYQGESN